MKGYGVIVHETQNFGKILFAFVCPSVRPSHICFTRTTPPTVFKSDFKNTFCILLLMTCRFYNFYFGPAAPTRGPRGGNYIMNSSLQLLLQF